MGDPEEIHAEEESEKDLVKKGICPVCRSKLRHKEGCIECPQCGWSACVEA